MGYIDREVQILISDPKLWCYCSLPFYRTKPTAYFIIFHLSLKMTLSLVQCHAIHPKIFISELPSPRRMHQKLSTHPPPSKDLNALHL